MGAGKLPSRRTVLAFGAGAGLVATAGSSAYAASGSHGGGVTKQFRALEREYDSRLGVFARNTATGKTVVHRADERFPMCSVFKVLAAAAVLRDLDHHGEVLGRRIRYTEEYVTAAGYAPVTRKPENIANGLTVEELCAAALGRSDNGAANLLLRELGGPQAVTRFARSVGDEVTRLDRWEPELNSSEPWRITDTSSPRAIGGTFGRLILGDVLPRRDRRRLTTWMTENTTNVERFGAAFPDDWTLADKTGTGAGHGVANDVGVVRPPHGPPLVLSVLSATTDPAGPTGDPLVVQAARLAAQAVT